ncbi:hypothetical protein NE237_001896 [Protea cynaroides]|uniref:CCHC-type domain-containing protein n=1 Tax=Protea cynaroides TaxID=273540 RepID=A0A9Q0KU61_9MAGN|nr:hypothetical protein NE237_001896 [Protea cynaroides]
METNDNEGQQGQKGNIGTQNTAPQNVHTQANPTNLPAPPTDLTTAVMNLAQQMQQIQQVQANMQVAMEFIFQLPTQHLYLQDKLVLHLVVATLYPKHHKHQQYKTKCKTLKHRKASITKRESYFTQNRGIKRPNGNSYNGGNSKTFKPFCTQGFNAAAKTTPTAQPQQKQSNARVKCFNCDQVRHYSRECPKPRKQLQQGKVFIVTSKDVVASPNVVTGLPPNRVTKFVIDLIPEAAPVSTALYRMAPTVLKELKIVADLLDEVKAAIKSDPYLRTVQENLEKGRTTLEVTLDVEKVLRYKGRVCVLENEELGC